MSIEYPGQIMISAPDIPLVHASYFIPVADYCTLVAFAVCVVLGIVLGAVLGSVLGVVFCTVFICAFVLAVVGSLV